MTTASQANTPKDPFSAGIELYDIKLQEGEINLVPEVRSILTKAGIDEETVAGTYDVNRHVKNAQGRNSVAQRVQLNQFFQLALISAPVNTVGLRAELFPSGSSNAWLEIVETKVAPFIKEHKLLG